MSHVAAALLVLTGKSLLLIALQTSHCEAPPSWHEFDYPYRLIVMEQGSLWLESSGRGAIHLLPLLVPSRKGCLLSFLVAQCLLMLETSEDGH
ncbi:hypothetical protein C4D60_Mb02t09990 [Musa balbisiana]|uniref:Secreted protein n=1 Tax=Musa balbisiana TaxID=52838 RepID=A0A4S8I9K2_MUSBA|nr:hypothetical protein C4D60_Mb02t09990 [Musa balbisiana]